MTDDYSENMDWDLIYRVFHRPEQIAENIRSLLGTVDGPVVFCGFPEVAALLSTHYDITFVDYSQAIVEATRLKYPEINSIVRSEITEYLCSNQAKHIVISGRLSAFWQSSASFQALAEGLQCHPRTQVLIDYFDVEKVSVGLQTSFSAEQGAGQWDYQGIKELQSDNPKIQNVTLGISYTVGSMNFSYLTQRAYFDQSSMQAWHNLAFENYQTSVASGLLEADPSFTIHMQTRTELS